MTAREAVRSVVVNAAALGLIWALLFLPGCGGGGGCPRDQVWFAGRCWQVKAADAMAPGPNAWSAGNVTVEGGRLRLRVAQQGGEWACAEVFLPESLGYGEYVWEVEGDFGSMDPRIVFGAFVYASDTEELDAVEVSRWCLPDGPVCFQHAVQPADCTADPPVRCERFACDATRFRTSVFWTAGTAEFRLRDLSSGETLSEWTYEGSEVPQALGRERARMNLWIYRRDCPGEPAQAAAVTVRDFRFSPALSITSPTQDATVVRMTTVRGLGPPGRTVSVDVLPEGDHWYPQGTARIGSTGGWRLSCWIGNESTPVGHRFTIRARSSDGQEAAVDVFRR